MLVLSFALAQTPPDSDAIGVPELDADLLHRALATRRTSITEDAGRIRDTPVGGFQLGLGYANAPLVVSWDGGNGREQVSVVRDAFVIDLIGTLEYDRFRFGLDVPVYPIATSDLGVDGTALGNVAVDGRLTVLDPTRDPVGIGLIARLDLPSPDAARAIASPRIGYELAAAVERDIGALGLAANVGWRGLPRAALYNVTWDDLLFGRLAASWALSDEGGISAEGVVATIPSMLGADPVGDPRGAPTPAEVLVGGWLSPSGVTGLSLRGAVGTGVSRGVGSPRFRGIVDVVWTPTFGPRDADGDGLVDRLDGCPGDAEDLDGFSDDDGCPDWDNDGDGFDDEKDACPNEAEDVDGFLDDDGCPDPRAKVLIRVVDDRDAPVGGAILQVSGEGLEPTADQELDLHPGEYTVVAFAGGFKPSQTSFTIATARDEVIRVVLERNPPGTAVLTIHLPKGQSAPPGLAVQVGDKTARVVDGRVELGLPPGSYPVSVDGFEPYAAWRGSVVVKSDAVSELDVELAPSQVGVEGDRVVLRRSLAFNDAGLLAPQSAVVLGQLTALLHDRPGLRLRIESHTRTTGEAEANEKLSKQRADAVKRWLVAGGVEGSRLQSVGLGGTVPLPGRSDAANERIELHVVP